MLTGFLVGASFALLVWVVILLHRVINSYGYQTQFDTEHQVCPVCLRDYYYTSGHNGWTGEPNCRCDQYDRSCKIFRKGYLWGCANCDTERGVYSGRNKLTYKYSFGGKKSILAHIRTHELGLRIMQEAPEKINVTCLGLRGNVFGLDGQFAYCPNLMPLEPENVPKVVADIRRQVAEVETELQHYVAISADDFPEELKREHRVRVRGLTERLRVLQTALPKDPSL